MPGRLTLSLRPLGRRRPAGAALQAATLDAIRQRCPELAARLHNGGNPPIYHTALRRQTSRWDLHVGLAQNEDLQQLLQAWMLEPPETLRFGRTTARLLELDASRGAVAWEELLSHPVERVQLWFHSPTLFRSPSRGPGGPRPVRVFPSPERVLAALQRRWTALSSVPLEPELELAAWVNEHDLQGRIVSWPGARSVRGFIGSVTWHVHDHHATIGALLRLGELLGVGSRTTQGCGDLEITIL